MTQLSVFVTPYFLFLSRRCFNCHSRQLSRPLLSLVTPHSFEHILVPPYFITLCGLVTHSTLLRVVPGLFLSFFFLPLSPASLFFLSPPQMWPPQSRRSSSSRSYDSAAFSSTSCPTRWATWNGRKWSGRRWAKWWSTSPTTGMSSQSPSTRRWCIWSVEPARVMFVVKAEDEGEN